MDKIDIYTEEEIMEIRGANSQYYDIDDVRYLVEKAVRENSSQNFMLHDILEGLGLESL